MPPHDTKKLSNLAMRDLPIRVEGKGGSPLGCLADSALNTAGFIDNAPP